MEGHRLESFIDSIDRSPSGIVAELQRNVTVPDQDGQSWHFSVSDRTQILTLKVSASGSERVRIGVGLRDTVRSYSGPLAALGSRIARIWGEGGSHRGP